MTALEPAPGSARLRLAAVAEAVVSEMDDVALTGGTDGRWRTVGGDTRVQGVTAVADTAGGYELGLHLVVSWPPEPLVSLADELRRRIRGAAARDGLAAQLGSIEVHVAGVEEPAAPGGES